MKTFSKYKYSIRKDSRDIINKERMMNDEY